MTIGKNLKNTCEQKGLSLAELSRISGVKYSTLRDIANDNSDTAISNIIKICDSLSISIDELVKDNQDLNKVQKD